jgi:DNA-binding NarL/FixJ family response regulator
MSIIRILFARSSELWWDGLERLLKEREQYEILGICCNGLDTIQKATLIKPDIILLDEEMADCGSVEVAQNMNKISPDTHIIMIIKPYKNIDINVIFKSRAKGYIDKDITLDELVKAIENVTKGGMVVISPLVAKHMLRYLDQSENLTKPEENDDIKRKEFEVNLSKRELQILTLLAMKGNTNKEIADVLYISENTVKSHVANIIWKMNVRNRQQAAAVAREKGILQVSYP